MTELESLKEEVKLLRERIAALEFRLNQPARDGFPVWQPVYLPKFGEPIPCVNPYEVTCRTQAS